MLILDVSELLFPNVYSCDYFQSLNLLNISIILPNWSCNDNNYTIFDFSRFTLLESIEIGDDSFGLVTTFQIDGMNRLKTIKIGQNSFTQHKKYRYGNDPSKSFHILNCESLESIQIDEWSFSDYGGEFELKNLPQLQSIQIGQFSFSDYGGEFELKNLPQLRSIQIGKIWRSSCNFYGSSFEIGGIELTLNI